MEDGFGIPYDRPALHTREYLSVMRPLLEEGAVQFNGEFFNCNLELAALERPSLPHPGFRARPADGCRLAGELADGTVTWMAGPRTIESHTSPLASIAARRRNSGRSEEPRVCVGTAHGSHRRRERRGARRPPSPTRATAIWSTTAASWTSRESRARQRLRSSATRVRSRASWRRSPREAPLNSSATSSTSQANPKLSRRAYEALKALVGKV